MSSPLYNLKKTHRTPLPRVTPSPNFFNHDGDSPRNMENQVQAFPNTHQMRPPLTCKEYNMGDDALLDDAVTYILKNRKQSRGMIDPFRNNVQVLTPAAIMNDRKMDAPVNRMADNLHESNHRPERNTSCSDEKSVSKSTRKSPNSNRSPSVKSMRRDDAPSDKELMALMMSRLSQLEQKVQKQSIEISQKDKTIAILKDKVDIMEKAKGSTSSPSHLQELETKCLLQQQQICEMEAFLADYGMTWVGDELDEGDTYVNSETSPSQTSQGLWKPDEAIARAFTINHDLIAKNIRELNILAGEGQSKIQHTADGARLKVQEAIPLTIYANGIVLYGGPFRSISETSTQRFVRDLHDRFFPSELQSQYPDGVPFSFVDKRGVYFRDKHEDLFYGPGRTLRQECDHSLDHRVAVTRELEEDSEVTGPKVSLETFLDKLPKNIIKDGKVVPVRNEIRENITGYQKDETTSKEKSASSDSSPGAMTLRIRSPTGQSSVTVKLKADSTIGDLRKCINKKRPKALPYNLVLPYPHTLLDNDRRTLAECGISCSAVLHMIAKKQ